MISRLPFSKSAVSVAILGLLPAISTAQETVNVKPSQMVQGGTGLIQTPTARMQDAGDLYLNYTDNGEYRFWSVNLQLFDWMQATARYTDVRTRLYSQVESFSGDQTLKDKGLDVKFRLWEESYYMPDISVGFRDFGGTGFFESEYVVASKSVGPLDFHVGLGWGYMGSADDFTNPFCKLRDSFCERPLGYSGLGGKVDYDQFFKGKMAVYGGVEYQTPWEPLTLKLEWEGNTYEFDRAGELEQDTRLNVGAVYKWNGFDFSLNYQRGNTVGFGVSYKFNLHTMSQIKIDDPPRDLMNTKRPASLSEINGNALFQGLIKDASFILTDVDIQEEKAIFYGYQNAYRDNDEAIERTGRVLASELPESVKTYHVVEARGGLPMVENVIDADAFIAAARYESLDADIKDTWYRKNPDEALRDGYAPAANSGFFHSADLFWTQTFGSPEDFYLYQTGIIFTAGYAFNENWSVVGGLSATVLDNFDKFNFTVDKEDTPLPRVRTQVREYVTNNRFSVDTAFLNWKDQLSDEWFGQAYAGYLERMFAGVGGELLYRPVDSRIAYGIDINYVKQRDFDDQFSFLDYDTFTGHASVYWQPEFLPDTQLTVSAGQFLAGDRGVNIDFAKRFDSGVIVGAYAAFTDVSSEDYGEGSFTKGFYLSIPLDLFLLEPAKGRGMFPWIPISRDGGQLLRRPVRLIDFTEPRSPFYN